MPRRYFNWKLAIVLVIGLVVLAVTAYGLRQWQRTRRAERGFELGIQAYNEHRWEEAAQYLGRYIGLRRGDTAALLKYAEAQLNIRPLRSANLKQAVDAYRVVLRADKSNTEAAMQLTQIYLQLGMPGEAELIARRTLQTTSENGQTGKTGPATAFTTELRRMLAMALALQGKFDDAVKELKSIIEQHPEQVAAYETIGTLCEQRPDLTADPPAEWFNQAVDNNPSNAFAYIIRASFYLRSNNIELALADLEKAQKLDLSDAPVRLRLAQELINADLLDLAERQLSEVQKVEPENIELWRIWARLAMKEAVQQKMKWVADTGLKQLSYKSLDFLPQAAELFIQAQEYNRAYKCIKEMQEQQIRPGTTAYLQGLLAYREDKVIEAVRYLRRAQQHGQTSERVGLLLASAFSRLGDRASARGQLETLVSDNPRSLAARLALARLLMEMNNSKAAEKQALMAIQIAPKNARARLAYVRARLNSLAVDPKLQSPSEWQGLERYLDALEKAFKNPLPVKLLRFQMLVQKGEVADAQNLLEQLKKSYPDEVKLVLAEAELLITQKKPADAIAILKEAISRFPKATEPVQYLAILSADADERQLCEKVLKEALERFSRPTVVRQLGLMLAQYYAKWKQDEKEYHLLQRLIKREPNDILLKRRLLRCKAVRTEHETARQIVEDIKSLEGEDGWQWRYEKARLLFESKNFDADYHQIVSLLKENLLTNPDSQASRLLLAAAYERAGRLRLAIAAYQEALSRAPDDIGVIVPTVAALYKANEYDRADEILKRATATKPSSPQLIRLQLQSKLIHEQFDSAADILETLLADEPNNNSVCLSLALIRMQQNKFEEAQQLINKLKSHGYDSFRTRATEIELKVREGDSEQALRLCDRTVGEFKNASAYILRARTYARLGWKDQALKDLEQAASVEPDNPAVWVAESAFYNAAGKSDKAAELMEKALSLSPNNVDIQKRTVALLLAATDRQKVLRGKNLLQTALKSHPDDIGLQLLKSRSLLAEGTAPAVREAKQILEKITQVNPRITEAWILLGRLLLNEGKPARAMDIALRGLAHQPDSKPLLLLKARAEAVRSPALAIPTLKGLLELDPNDLNVVIRLAQIYTATGQSSKAVALIEKQLQNPPGQLQQHRLEIELATALYKTGQKSRAMNVLDSLCRSRSDDPAPLLAQVMLFADEGLWEPLKQKVNDWSHRHSDDTETPITAARYLSTTQKPEALRTAVELLKAVLDNDPDCLPAMNALAIALQVKGDTDQSAALYQRIIELQPDNVVAMNNLAWILAEHRGKFQKALELAQRGLKQAPNYADLIDTRGMIYLHLGRYDKAVEDFTRCLQLYPENTPAAASSHLHLAKALVKLGEKNRAMESLKKASELNSRIGGLSPADAVETQRLIKKLSEGA